MPTSLNVLTAPESTRAPARLVCVHNVRLPTEKAHGVQISKMCESFAAHGAEVSLLIPTRDNLIKTDLFLYYQVERSFVVRYIACTDMLTRFPRMPRIGFYGQALSFLWGLRSVPIPLDANILTRNPEIVWWYGRKGYTVYFDAHNFPSKNKKIFTLLLKNVAGIITNSNGTREAFICEGFKNVIAVPNGVDLEQFANGKKGERKASGLPNGRIAMYVGHLYGWKGVDIVVEAARRSTDKDLVFVFVGGTDQDLHRYRIATKDQQNIIFLGHKTRQEIPDIIAQADVLLLPNVPSSQESIAYTSPIKLFEYMASGVPIVASDLPSIREILHEENAVLVEPGNPEAILQGIQRSFTPEALLRAERARQEVEEYTWKNRAQKILTYMKTYVRNHR